MQTISDLSRDAYDLGKCVGLITRRYDNPNFHKHRVGRLSRLVAHLDGLIAFRNHVIEKVTLQQHLYPNVVHAIQHSSRLIIAMDAALSYDAEAFKSGFFATYLKPLSGTEMDEEWDVADGE